MSKKNTTPTPSPRQSLEAPRHLRWLHANPGVYRDARGQRFVARRERPIPVGAPTEEAPFHVTEEFAADLVAAGHCAWIEDAQDASADAHGDTGGDMTDADSGGETSG